MDDASPPNTEPCIRRWPVWYLLVAVLPSIVFLLLFPWQERIDMVEAYRHQEQWVRARELAGIYYTAAVQCSLIAALVALGAAVFLGQRLTRTEKDRGITILSWAVTLLMVNAAICAGGCSLR